MKRLAVKVWWRPTGAGGSTWLLSALLLVALADTAWAAGVRFTTLAAKMTVQRSGHTATLLPSGKVILMGGENLCCGTGTTYDSAELYDPVANAFTTLTATMTTPREEYAATLLPNGKVLLVGGFNDNSDCLDTAEVYDPVANTFTALSGTMTAPRCDPTATLLSNGLVLITGGGIDGVTYNTAEMYDPVANTFTALSATMTSVRSSHTATLLLPSGLVLLTGGVRGSGKGSSSDFNTAEVYDPVANTFTALSATMTTARYAHTATRLSNGQVLIAGGAHGSLSNPVGLNTAEVYDPVADTFTALSAAMTSVRALHTATLLLNGEVLITGGAKIATVTALNTAELYTSGPANTATTTPTQLPTGTPVATSAATRTRTVTAAAPPTQTPTPPVVITGPIGASDTCIPVSDTAPFSPPGYAFIGGELISYTGLGTSCGGASAASTSAGVAATAGALTGVTRSLNGQGGPHAAGTAVTPTAPPSPCVGDCDQSGTVTVDELIKGVNIALGILPLAQCPQFDCNSNGQVTIDCLVKAVNAALNGCVATP